MQYRLGDCLPPCGPAVMASHPTLVGMCTMETVHFCPSDDHPRNRGLSWGQLEWPLLRAGQGAEIPRSAQLPTQQREPAAP